MIYPPLPPLPPRPSQLSPTRHGTTSRPRAPLRRLPHVHHATNTIALLHRLECCVDIVQRLAVRDELVHLQLAGQVVVNQARELGAAFDAAEGAAFPDAAGDELEGWD